MIEDNEISTVNWSVVDIDTTPMNDDELFYIPEDAKENSGSSDDYYDDIPVTGSARDILLYEVNTIAVEEKGIDDMTQIFYYSDASYDLLVAYFKGVLEGTEGYSVYEQEKRTSIDGTINGKSVIVIVNNYKKYEPEVGMNGVNVNY